MQLPNGNRIVMTSADLMQFVSQAQDEESFIIIYEQQQYQVLNANRQWISAGQVRRGLSSLLDPSAVLTTSPIQVQPQSPPPTGQGVSVGLTKTPLGGSTSTSA
jgi:hypothetical protein